MPKAVTSRSSTWARRARTSAVTTPTPVRGPSRAVASKARRMVGAAERFASVRGLAGGGLQVVDGGLDGRPQRPLRARAGGPGPSGRPAPRSPRSRRTCCAGRERSRWPCPERSRPGRGRQGRRRGPPRGDGTRRGGRLPCGGRGRAGPAPASRGASRTSPGADDGSRAPGRRALRTAVGADPGRHPARSWWWWWPTIRAPGSTTRWPAWPPRPTPTRRCWSSTRPATPTWPRSSPQAAPGAHLRRIEAQPRLRAGRQRGARRGRGGGVLPVLPRRRPPRSRRGPDHGGGGLPVQRRHGRGQGGRVGRPRPASCRWAWGPTRPVPRPRYVERGELDQEQHDAVRDVFYVPGAATLVRADLFTALGGFDPGIELLGEDLDLSWRAHVVGARVLVAPGARIAHLEALGQRRPVDDRRRLQMRHRLRTSRVAYTAGQPGPGDAPGGAAGAGRVPVRRGHRAVPPRRRRRRRPGRGTPATGRGSGPGASCWPPTGRWPTATSAGSRCAAAPGWPPSCGASWDWTRAAWATTASVR